jgi:nucleoid-associated protein YgaU
MTLSLEALHQPLNDFFLSRYATAGGSPILFRFDKFGSVFSDADFRDGRQPDAAYDPALALERVSDLVNRIPVDTGDGFNVILTGDSIDNYYERLLNGAQAYFPEEADAATRDSILSSFSAMQSRAMLLWDQLKLESITGRSAFWPAEATPTGWVDPGDAVWINASFEIAGDDDRQGQAPEPMQWTLPPSDVVLAEALNLPSVEVAVAAPQAVNLAERAAERHVSPMNQLRPRMAPMVRDHRAAAAPKTTGGDFLTAGGVLNRTLQQQSLALDVRKRILVQQYVETMAPVEPVQTSKLTVSFDYCLVNVKREWLLDSFINDTSWHIPNVGRGELTSSQRPGNLPLLPVGFVAIRDLHIAANWSAEDLALADTAMTLGPFRVQPGSASGQLTQHGLQVIGWMVQLMPPLPPNPMPHAAPDPATTHTVAKGETLWAIAKAAYGEGSRWAEIAHANNITDPTRLKVGQVLTIP